MAQMMSGSRGVESLWNISSAVVKKNIPISVDLLCGLPQPLVEELAVCLHWSDLLKLEEFYNCKTVTEKAWRQEYESLGVYEPDEMRPWSRSPPTCDCHSKVRFPLTYRDRWFSWLHSMILTMGIKLTQESQFKNYTADSSQSTEEEAVKMLRQLKKVSLDLATVDKMPIHHPQFIAPLTTSLVVLKVDFRYRVQFFGSGTWLQVLKELMQNGRLRILHLLNMGVFTVEWLVLFFIISGLFHCSRCTRYFPVLLDMERRVQCPPLRTGVCLGATNTESRFTGSRATRAAVGGLDLGYGQSASNHDNKLGLTLRLVNMLRDLGYTGLTGVAETEHSASTSHHAHTSRSAPTGETDDSRTGASSSAFQDSTEWTAKEESLWTDAVVSGCQEEDWTQEEEEELEEGGLGAEESHGAEVASTTSDHCYDLLDEALGVFSDHEEEDYNALLWMENLSDLHKMEGHESRGVEHLSASWKVDANFEGETWVRVHQGLRSVLSGWSSLSSVDLDFSVYGNVPLISFDYNLLFYALLERIKAGTLHSVALNCSDTMACLESTSTFLCRVLKFLVGLDGTSHDGRGIQPLKLLKIESCGLKTFPILLPDSDGDISADQPEKADCTDCRTGFPGVQELDLKVVVFNGVRELSPVAYLIRNCDVLSRISLQDCSLKKDCVDLLLQALDSRVHSSLTCINLQNSLCHVTSEQWEKLCHIVGTSPSLRFLSLARCGLSGEQITSAAFVNAVKLHGTTRQLTLNLSSNGFGDSIWDFIAATVCPGSSLKGLHFKLSGGSDARGFEVLKDMVDQHADHLPLLKVGSATSTSSPLFYQVSGLLKQVAQDWAFTMDLYSEFMAVM
ncbi:uncharacterized protein LOC143279872 isoform X2 [Babylonia areolata]|uniref:uncharacterized protein LOC143279872 isoform X2 n=1 Tax=Babylonia areolata TaxID=304850 RepID=UPI003FD1B9D8